MKKMHLAGFALVSVFALSACGDPGPGEQAGEAFDDGMDRMEDSYDSMMGNDGPMEEAGREADEAYEDTRDAAEDTYEDMTN